MKRPELKLIFIVFLPLFLNACGIAQIFKEYKIVQLSPIDNIEKEFKGLNKKNISNDRMVVLNQMNNIVDIYQNEIYPLYKKGLHRRMTVEKYGKKAEEMFIEIILIVKRWSGEISELAFLLGDLPNREKEEGKRFIKSGLILSKNFNKYFAKSKMLNRSGIEWNLGALNEKDRLAFNELADTCEENMEAFKSNLDSFFFVLLKT